MGLPRLGEVLHGILWNFSYFGTLDDADDFAKKIAEQAHSGEWITFDTFEDFRKMLDSLGKSTN